MFRGLRQNGRLLRSDFETLGYGGGMAYSGGSGRKDYDNIGGAYSRRRPSAGLQRAYSRQDVKFAKSKLAPVIFSGLNDEIKNGTERIAARQQRGVIASEKRKEIFILGAKNAARLEDPKESEPRFG